MHIQYIFIYLFFASRIKLCCIFLNYLHHLLNRKTTKAFICTVNMVMVLSKALCPSHILQDFFVRVIISLSKPTVSPRQAF